MMILKMGQFKRLDTLILHRDDIFLAIWTCFNGKYVGREQTKGGGSQYGVFPSVTIIYEDRRFYTQLFWGPCAPGEL